MTTTPNPILIKKMQRMALQILASATPRTTVTSTAMELVMEDVSLASPKLRRELLDAHLAALDWIFKDAFTSQVPTATFEADVPIGTPDDIAAGAEKYAPDRPVDLEGIREQVRAILARNRKLQAAVDLMPEALAHAFNWGYIAGEADTNPHPDTAEFANLANPYGNVTE